MKPRFTLKQAAAVIAMAGLVSVIPAQANAKVVIKYWAKWNGLEAKQLQEVIDKYNQSQSKVEVKFSTIPVEQIQEKYLTATIAGSGPDIVQLWNHRIAFFVQQGLIQPLDPYLKTMGISRNSMIGNYWDMMSMNGKVYALPITNSCFGLFINRTVFEDSGIDGNTTPKSFDDMIALGEKVSRRDATGKYTRVGFALNDPGWWPYIWGPAFGANLYEEKTDTVALDNPNMVKAYDFVSSMSKKWGQNVLGVLKAGGNGSKTSALLSGKTAMEINGSWTPSNFAREVPKVKYSIHQIPYGGGRTQPWSWLESDMVFMSKTKHPKESVDFLRYLMGVEAQQKLNLLRETHSAVRAANTPEFIKQNGNPGIESIVRLAGSDSATWAPQTIIWTDLADTFSTIFNDVWNQKKSATQALADAKNPIMAALKKISRRKH